MRKSISMLFITILLGLTLCFSTVVSTMCMPLIVSADATHTDQNAAYRKLLTTLIQGEYTYQKNGVVINVTDHQYKITGGGYANYPGIWDTAAVSADLTAGAGLGSGAYFSEKIFGQLTNNGKKKFLTDVLTIANAMVDDTEAGFSSATDGVDAETVQIFCNVIQDTAGMGTTMLTSILQNTKPDYTTANRIYEPFSGVVGTILGLVSILIMALLGVSMALDIAYLTIPAFNMMCTGNDTGQGNTGGDNSKSTLGGFISKEAKKAYKAADGGEGGQGQGGAGDYKAAVGTYFKYRWTGLLLLGICLLYLVQGQIYTLIAWIIDLVSGFLDF